ncbi:MAG: phenylalanine--tRNA ligase subunit beta [Acidimicrobiales bacterium]
MLVPLSWLREYVDLDLGLDDLIVVLAELGLAVESVQHVGQGLDGVVVAKVLAIGSIEGADKIRVVQVDDGAGPTAPVQVVCGAWNFEVGDVVPFARVGAVLPGDFAIATRKMKGVVSNGMLCAADELGLPGADHAEGILLLDRDLPPGSPFAEVMGIEADVILELEINANRPDAMSMVGVARDLAARLGVPLRIPEPKVIEDGRAVGDLTTLVIEATDGCGRFVSRVLSGVKVGPSPDWMARRLTLAGMRPINNVVDVSNYVMLELGQPNHAYDLHRVTGHGLRVRRARPGETLVTLDDVERRLVADDLLICDAEDVAVGLAGIMGGASCEIDDRTTEVLIESAWFQSMAIATTSKRLGLRSEASARFERGADPEMAAVAAARFCELLTSCSEAPISVASGMLDRVGAVAPQEPVRLRTARVNALLGTTLQDEQISGHLRALGFRATSVAEGVHDVRIPSWRPDCSVEVDLIEEVARLHGYTALPKTVPSSPHFGRLSAYQQDRRLVRQILVGAGASEAWCTTFLAPVDLQRLGLAVDEAVVVANPLAAEESLLRTSLLPGLLASVAYNESHRNAGVALFEIGRTFRRPVDGGPLPDEREMAAVVLAGRDATEAVSTWWLLAEGLGVRNVRLVADAAPGLHATRTARIVVGGTVVGWVGEADPTALATLAIAERVGWLEIDLAILLDLPHGEGRYRPISRYPSSDVDLAFVVAERVPAGEVEATLREAGGDLLVRLGLFDVYRGEPVPAGHRSLAYAIRFQAPDRTLTDDEVAHARRGLIDAVEAAHGAALRA